MLFVFIRIIAALLSQQATSTLLTLWDNHQDQVNRHQSTRQHIDVYNNPNPPICIALAARDPVPPCCSVLDS